MHRRALTAALASASVALGGALAVTTVPAAQAEDPESPLVLTAPHRVVARSFHGHVYSDLGVRMRAQGEKFEIQARRPEAYDGPIAAVWKQWDAAGDPLPDVALPNGSMSTWLGLDRFAKVTVLDDGEPVRTIGGKGCFNGDARKVGPGSVSGPTTYPWGCPWNPYTLGSVMGVDQDYSSSLLPEWGTRLRLRPGTYEVVATVRPKWREFFGISEADGTVDTTLEVRKAREREWRRTAARPSAQPAARPTARTGSDDLEPTTEAPTTSSQGAMADPYAPDLRSLPAFGVGVNRQGTALRFGATVWNGGKGPMVIEGFREAHEEPAGTEDHGRHMTAYQYYFDGNGNQTGFDEVGEFAYHAANHNHWHFEDFARYRLFTPDPADPDLPGKVAVRSTKASFCLVATDAVDLTVENAEMRPEYTDLGSQCGGRRSQMLRQVLANGHGDTYHQYRAGQAFRIGNLEDGIYYISVEANPDDRNGRNLSELAYDNNDSYRKVEIYTTPRGVRRARTFQVGVVDENAGFGFFRTR